MKRYFKFISPVLWLMIMVIALNSCDKNDPDSGESAVTASELMSQPSFVNEDAAGDKIILKFTANQLYVKGVTKAGEVTREMQMSYTLSGEDIRIEYLLNGYMEMQCAGRIWKYTASDGSKTLYLHLDSNDLIGSYLNKTYRFSSENY